MGRIFFALSITLISCVLPATAADTEINVRIDNVRNSSGRLFVALYDGKQWLKPGRYISAQKIKAQRGTVRATFRGVPRGLYGIAVFHDENMNSRVDTNFIGLPKEGFGFSRISPLRKPKFGEVSFNVSPRANAPIRLRY